jgi:hypothetical protein
MVQKRGILPEEGPQFHARLFCLPSGSYKGGGVKIDFFPSGNTIFTPLTGQPRWQKMEKLFAFSDRWGEKGMIFNLKLKVMSKSL